MAWLSDYTYRKKITITGQSGAGTNYQVKLLIGKASGATGEQFDLEGHCLDTFADIRFTDNDEETELKYWIESVAASGTSYLANVWVKVADSLESNVDIYCYYGKTGDTTTSSGADTFGSEKFDNFEWGSDGDNINTSGGNVTWTEVNTDVNISTEQEYTGIAADTRSMKLIGAASPSRSSLPLTAETVATYALYCFVYKETAAQFVYPINHGNGTKVVLVGIDVSEEIFYYDTQARFTGKYISADAWNTVEARNINFTAGTFDIYANGSLVKAGAAMYSGNLYTNVFAFQNQSGAAGKDAWIDNVIVRKWVATEPAFSSAGDETEEAANTSFTATLTETLTSSDILTKFTIWSTILSDTFNLSDTLDRLKTGLLGLSDSIGLTDTLSKIYGFVINISETLSLLGDLIVELETGITEFFANLSETITTSDTFTKITTFGKTLSDIITTTENWVLDELNAFYLTLTEEINISDTLSKIKGFISTLAETIGLTDILTRFTIWSTILTETFTLSDALSSIKSFFTDLSETIGLTDTLSKLTTWTKTFTESTTISDSLGKLYGKILTLTEIITASDTISIIRNVFLSISETFNLSDTLSKLTKWIKELIEVSVISDIISFGGNWWNRMTKHISSWTHGTKHTSSWTEDTKHSSSWTHKNKSN